METEKLELPVEDLLLDKENPRIGQVGTQTEALSAIVDLDTRFFRTMMNSIREHGLDPGDSFYVILDEEDDASYVVVDGNRRLAALKVLSNTPVLQGTKLADSVTKPLVNAAQGFVLDSVDPVSCVLFPSRADANEWILRRHGRGMEGEGRIPWGTLETQRFQKDRTILDVIAFVERNSTFPEAEWQFIKQAVEASPSILRRFIESKKGREWLGLTVEEVEGKRVPYFSRDPRLALDVLSKIFSDISRKAINTRSHNKASEIGDYFDNLPSELHSSDTVAAEPQAFWETEVEDTEVRPRLPKQLPAIKASVNSATTKAKPPRVTLAPSRHTFAQPKDEKTVQLLREAVRIKIKDMPLASAFILRAFLQQTINAYMTENTLPFWENNKQLELSVRADRVITHLVQNKKALSKDLAGVKRNLASSADPASIKALNDYHHDRYQVPAVDVLRGAWDSSIPLFQAVFGPA